MEENVANEYEVLLVKGKLFLEGTRTKGEDEDEDEDEVKKEAPIMNLEDDESCGGDTKEKAAAICVIN